jgi:hypothetical protein
MSLEVLPIKVDGITPLRRGLGRDCGVSLRNEALSGEGL